MSFYGNQSEIHENSDFQKCHAAWFSWPFILVRAGICQFKATSLYLILEYIDIHYVHTLMVIVGATTQGFVAWWFVTTGETALMVLHISRFHFLCHIDTIWTAWTPVCGHGNNHLTIKRFVVMVWKNSWVNHTFCVSGMQTVFSSETTLRPHLT